MKEIRLRKSDKFALVDDGDYDYLNQFKWYLMNNCRNSYAITSVVNNGKRKMVLMHRAILTDAPTLMDIDHIDRNGLNNQRFNLRIVTHSENLNNSRQRDVNTSIKMRREDKKTYIVYKGFLRMGQFNIKSDAIKYATMLRKQSKL